MLKQIQDYLKRVAGIEFLAQENRAELSLAPYVSLPHDFWFCQSGDMKFEVMALKRDAGANPTPRQIASFVATVSERLGGVPTVYAVERLEAYNRGRLLAHHVPFVVPNRQFYLPFLNMSFSEVGAKRVKEFDRLGVLAQMMLVDYLNRGENGLSIPSSVVRFGYTRISVMKAFDELEYFQLAQRDRRSHALEFSTDRRALFGRARKLLRNPCRRVVMLDAVPSDLNVCESGLNALAKISMINPPDYVEYAVESSAFGKCSGISPVPRSEARVHLELWCHEPAFVYGDRIDPISLCLSFSNDDDERVQGAIEEVLEKMKW